MDDPKYLREQALMCISIAMEMSNIRDCEALRKKALQYTLRAEAAEEALRMSNGTTEKQKRP